MMIENGNLMQRYYLNVNCGVGQMNSKEENMPYKADSLLEEMAYHRIHVSLAYSNISTNYSFTKGNRELLAETGKGKRLLGMAVVMPGLQYEVKEGFAYIDDLLAQGVKAVKIYPRSFNHGFDPFTNQKLANNLTERNIPLFIDYTQFNWRELRENLEAYKELNVVVCNVPFIDNRYLFALMENYNNLYFDIGSKQINDLLEICKKHFGIERVLFGTDYPFKNIGGFKAVIEYSSLNDADKDLVAYKNAMKLLNINPGILEKYKDNECKLDEIALAADAGNPVNNFFIIDSHAHLLDKKEQSVNCYIMHNSDEDSIIHKMNRIGINQILFSSFEGLTTDSLSANKTSLEAMKKYNGRIKAYSTFNPNYPEDLDEIINIYHKKNNFIGLKPYWPCHKYDLLGEKYEKWYEYGNINKLIMLVHTETGSSEITTAKVEQLALKYRDMAFILAHSDMSYEVAKNNIKSANKMNNIYLEITLTYLFGILEFLVESAGADKILFGTDLPILDPAPQFAHIAYSRISIADKKKILGENINKLLRRCYNNHGQ